MIDLASLRIAEDRVEWAVREVCESSHLYWDGYRSRQEAEDALRWFRRRSPDLTFDVVSHRVITTEWAEQ